MKALLLSLCCLSHSLGESLRVPDQGQLLLATQPWVVQGLHDFDSLDDEGLEGRDVDTRAQLSTSALGVFDGGIVVGEPEADTEVVCLALTFRPFTLAGQHPRDESAHEHSQQREAGAYQNDSEVWEHVWLMLVAGGSALAGVILGASIVLLQSKGGRP